MLELSDGTTYSMKSRGWFDDDEQSRYCLGSGGSDRIIINESGLYSLIFRSVKTLTSLKISSLKPTSGQKLVWKLNNSIVGISYNRTLHNTGELFLTEAGLYRLICKSEKPIAEKFQKWVCKEVLPSIRKTGSYSITKSPIERIFLLTDWSD